MDLKEHLLFLAMMTPTFLLLGAIALSLAFPPIPGEAPAGFVMVVPGPTRQVPAADDDR